jgi:hypothetical protein
MRCSNDGPLVLILVVVLVLERPFRTAEDDDEDE